MTIYFSQRVCFNGSHDTSACESYQLPEHLVPHVDFVTPTVHFDAKLSKRSDGGPSSFTSIGSPSSNIGPKTSGESLDLNQLGGCDEHITPACLRALYGFYYEPVAYDRNSFGVGEYGDVVEPSLSEAARSRVYPTIVSSIRSRYVRQELFRGSLWCQPSNVLYRWRYVDFILLLARPARGNLFTRCINGG